MNIGTTEIILILGFLSILAVPAIILFVVLKSRQSSASLEPCPFCAELIQMQAKVCRFCGRDLTT